MLTQVMSHCKAACSSYKFYFPFEKNVDSVWVMFLKEMSYPDLTFEPNTPEYQKVFFWSRHTV